MDIKISIIFIILLSIIVIICVININKQNKEINKIKQLKKEELKKFFKESWDKEEQDFNLKKVNLLTEKREIEGKVAQLKIIFKEKENQYKSINQDLEFYREGKIEEINNTVELYLKNKSDLIEQSIDEYRSLKMVQANNQLETMELQKEKLALELATIEADLEEERSKRAAINEEIRRAREAEEQQDFYRIQINPNDLEDIHLLRSIVSQLRHPEAINKIIWSGYYQKPLAELRKRAAFDGSGIYKITRLKTGEIYIGQAVNVSTRWAEHCKAALGVGTLASSQLHRVMAEDGPEQFTFEVLESAVPRDKLRERESFYIDFYDSKNYGLNTLRGDQNK